MKDKSYSDQLMLAATQKVGQRKYWMDNLSGELIKSHFPYDQNITSNDIHWERMEFRLGQLLCEKLLKLSKESDYSLNTILLTGLTLLLYKYTGNNDIIVGTLIYKPDIEGNFINTVLALRNRIPAGITFKELLLQMSKRIYHAVENQDYPIEVLADELNMMNSGIGFPLFDVILLLENIHDKKFIRDFNHNMTFSFLRTPEHITAVLDYNSNLFEKATIERIIQSFKVLLLKILIDMDTPISHIDLLWEKEKERLLYEFNLATGFNHQQKTLDRLFEEQVRQNPWNAALVDRDSQLTYLELNKRANRLARWLRKKGVRPDTIVGILVDRSPEMIIGIFAVLKVGGAYLPLDPQLPEKRIIHLLEDCRVTILLTQNSVLNHFFLPALLGFYSAPIQPHINPFRPRIENMDELPMIDRSLVDYSKYSQYIGYAGVKNCISLEATRGCPFGCIYCHKIFSRKHVFRSYEDIIAEVQFYYRLGIKRFLVIDDIFNLNVKNSTKFFEMVIKNKLDIQIFFSGGLRGDILTKEYVDLMVEAGTVLMAPALETASPRLQKLIKKNLKLEKLKENLDYICQTHPGVILELFIMHGFPTETHEEAMMTMNFIKGIKWVHFPYINILRIFSQTEMAKFAVENGIPYDAILRSEHMAFHELPETLPFDKSFTREFQTRFQDEYFLSKERLMDVLPHQMKLMTEDELIQKYNSYLPVEIRKFSDLLEMANIKENELHTSGFLSEERIAVPHFNERLKKQFQGEAPLKNALNVLLLDLSLYFSGSKEILYDLINEPLGLLRLLTQLKQKFGRKVNGKIVKSRIDFNSFTQLKNLIDEFKPDVIGIRTIAFYRDFFHKTASIIRQWGINVPIITGGPHVTTNFQEVLKDANIDLAVLGEGEITFCEIIEQIMENSGKLPGVETLKEIPGIAFVVDKSLLERKFPRQILILDTMEEQLAREDDDNLKGIRQPGDLAYVNFTSGSSGKPKGVMVEHKNLVGYLNAFFHEFDISEKDTVLQQASFSFDTFGEEIYPILLRGGKIVIINRTELLDIHFLADFLPKHGITVIDCSPLLLNELNKLVRVKCVDLFISGGDVLKNQHISHLSTVGRVYNTYGPTESTICATYYRCPANVSDRKPLKSTISIGKPIANYQVYILDKDHLILPVGIPGEISIGGIGVSRGYLNNPLLTKEKYIPHPFAGNQRFYKTGDLAKWLPDGNINFLGRIDHQVKIRGYRIEIGEIEMQMMRKDNIKEAVVITQNKSPDGSRENNTEAAHEFLVAFFVSSKQQPVMELREYLMRELPAYMIPTHFVQIETLPVTAGGKVDRRKLAAMDDRHFYKEKYMAPTNEIEKNLVVIWQQVLGCNPVGINDNFFLIGGDSIKSIQITARMNQLGYKIQMKDIFQNPTIEQLAPLVKKLEYSTSQELVTGIVTLTPVQKEFFLEDRQSPHHFNHAIMLFSKDGLDETALKIVFKKIHHHHDALRMTFKNEKGKIIQRIHGPDYPISLYIHNLRDITDKTHTFIAIRHRTNEIQTRINLETGPLTQLALFHTIYGDYLLIVIHHLVVDGVSWRILMEDIETLYRKYQQKEELVLPPKTDSFKSWAENLIQYANSETFLKESTYWEKLDLPSIPLIKKDFDEPTFIKDTTSLSFTINRQATHLLLNRANLAFGTEINDLLLTALGLAIQKTWGHKQVAIVMEGHGREDISPHLQVSRTIGWFTSVYPVVLNLSFAGNLSRQIKEVKENLHQLPKKGIGYGILKYLTKDVYKKDLNFHWHPQVTFNYLGQFDTDLEQMSSFRIANHLIGSTMDPEEKRMYELDISGMITNNQLEISVDYDKKQYKFETMENFMSHYREQLENIIDFCSTREKSELTPSDLTYNGLSIEMLEVLTSRYEIQDIYPLSPMQEGMLFHALSGNRTAFFEQISYRMEGELDIQGLEYSLNQLMKRYEILRTNFIYEGLERPLQVVRKHCQLEFLYDNLSEKINEKNKESQIAAFLDVFKEKDRQRSFHMGHDVLMRVAIFQLATKRYEFIWSIHHILMDGWCQGIIITDFFEIYNSYMQKRPWQLPPVTPYRNYIIWLEKQTQEVSLTYWEQYLKGYEKRALLPQHKEYNIKDYKFQLENYIITLDKEMSESLNKLAMKNNVTLNIVMQTIWGIILARWNYQTDVVFGIVVSGRPPEIEGIETMVGLFVNTVPLRVRFDDKTSFKQLIRRVQDEAVESEKYHMISLAEIQSRSALQEKLLHHIFIFENYPLIDQLQQNANINPNSNRNKTLNLTISNVDTYEQTNYDFYLQIFPVRTIRINFGYNANLYESDFIRYIGYQFEILARQIISDESHNIEELIVFLLTEENDGIDEHQVVTNEPVDIQFNI